jgi:DNA-directed RNA polymerase specialized sigma24 family protein
VRNIEGLSFEEIGKRIGSSAKTATRLHSQAFRQLSSLVKAMDKSRG